MASIRHGGNRRRGKLRDGRSEHRSRLRLVLIAASLMVLGLLAAGFGVYLGVVSSYHR